MRSPRRFRFTLAQLLLAAMFLALVLGLGLMVRSCAVEPFQAEWMTFSPDGGVLAAGLDDGTIRAWDVNTGEQIAELGRRRSWPLDHDYFDPTSCRLAGLPDKNTLTTVSYQGAVTCWDLATGEPSAAFHVPSAAALACSPDGKLLAAESYAPAGRPGPSATLEIWDVAQRRKLVSISRPNVLSLSELAISADHALLAASTYDKIEVFDVTQGTHLRSIPKGFCRPTFSPDLRWAATTGGDWDRPSITLWNLRTGEMHTTLPVRRGWVTAMAFSPDGERLAVADRNGKLRLDQVGTGEQVAAQSGCGDVFHLAFSPDGSRFAACEARAVLLWRHSVIRLRDPETLESRAVLWENDHRGEAGFLLVAFLVWLVVWRRVRRAERWRRGQPEVLPPLGESEVVLAASVEKTPAPPKVKKKSRLGVLWLVALVALLALAFRGPVEAAFDLGFWPSYALSLLFVVLALALAFLLLVGALILLHFFPQRSPEAELNLARQKTGEPGTLVRYGPLAAWFTGTCSLEQTFQEEFEAVRARHAQLMGRAMAIDQPLLVLCFQKVSTYAAYAPTVSLLTGYIVRWPRRVIVLCEDACWEQLGRPGRVLRTLYGYYFLPARRFSFLPTWLGYGATAILALDPGDARRRNRRVRKRLAEGKMLGPEEFLRHNDNALFRRLQLLEDREAYEAWWTYRDQAWSFVEFLAGEEGSDRRERFRRLVEAAPGCKDPAALIREVYGDPPEVLFDQWRAWAAVQSVEPEEPLPPPVREALEARVLPLVRDPQAPLARRLLALRAIAQWGGPDCREILARLLRDGPADIADEIRWASHFFSTAISVPPAATAREGH